jgi:hypothetical protein
VHRGVVKSLETKPRPPGSLVHTHEFEIKYKKPTLNAGMREAGGVLKSLEGNPADRVASTRNSQPLKNEKALFSFER